MTLWNFQDEINFTPLSNNLVENNIHCDIIADEKKRARYSCTYRKVFE